MARSAACRATHIRFIPPSAIIANELCEAKIRSSLPLVFLRPCCSKSLEEKLPVTTTKASLQVLTRLIEKHENQNILLLFEF